MAALEQILIPEVMLGYAVEQPLTEGLMWQTGAFVSDDRIGALLRAGSRRFEVPAIQQLEADIEANYSNTVYTDIAMPEQITATVSQGMMAQMNNGYVESKLATFLTKSKLPNANQLVQGMLDRYWLKQAENRAIATVYGLYNHLTGLGNAGDYITDASLDASTADSVFDVDAFIDAEATLDESLRGRGIMVVHSKVRAKMRKQNLIEQVSISSNLPPVNVYNGRVIVENDNITKITADGVDDRYITYLIGNGAFVADSAPADVPLEIVNTAATGNGAGHRVLWTRRNVLVHPQGFNFTATDAQLNGGTENEAIFASWEDLQNGALWSVAATNARQTSIRFLITNL